MKLARLCSAGRLCHIVAVLWWSAATGSTVAEEPKQDTNPSPPATSDAVPALSLQKKTIPRQETTTPILPAEATRVIGPVAELKPLSPEAVKAQRYRRIAWEFAREGWYKSARRAFGQAIDRDPEAAIGYRKRASYLVTCPDERVRNGQQAVKDAQQAIKLAKNNKAFYFFTLAAALAEAGNADEAVRWQTKAYATDQNKPYHRLIAHYRAGKTYRESLSADGRRRPYNPPASLLVMDVREEPFVALTRFEVQASGAVPRSSPTLRGPVVRVSASSVIGRVAADVPTIKATPIKLLRKNSGIEPTPLADISATIPRAGTVEIPDALRTAPAIDFSELPEFPKPPEGLELEVRQNGDALTSEGRYAQAMRNYNATIRYYSGMKNSDLLKFDLITKLTENLNGRALLRAACPDAKFRDGALAIADATKACERAQWKNAEYLATLAAAHAEAGDFAKAIHWQNKALDLSTNSEKTRRTVVLKGYHAKKPLRLEKPTK
jgi:tetratricopeptide (TPR) repeat protein